MKNPTVLNTISGAKDKKDNFISIAKAIGIILMVTGHAISQNYAYRFIYMFHMPIFFFCSGYFFRVPVSLQGVEHFTFKRIKGLYWPFLKWSFIFMLFHNCFCSWHLYQSSTAHYNVSDYILHARSMLFTMTGQEILLNQFWFLKELLLASVLVCMVTYAFRRFTFRYKDTALMLILIILTAVSKCLEWDLPIIWNVSLLFLSTTFFFAGFIYRKIEKDFFYSYKCFSISLLIVLFVVWIWNDFLDMLWYDAINVLLYIPTAIVGVFMVLNLSKMIEKHSIKTLFYYIGKNTIYILIFHLIVFKFVNYLKICIYGLPEDRIADFMIIKDYNSYFWIVYVLLGIAIPLSFQAVRKKLKN